MNEAVRESATRNALAYKMVQNGLLREEKNKEISKTPRIQEHANAEGRPGF